MDRSDVRQHFRLLKRGATVLQRDDEHLPPLPSPTGRFDTPVVLQHALGCPFERGIASGLRLSFMYEPLLAG